MFGVAPFTALTHADHAAYAQRSARMQLQNASRTSLPLRDDQGLIGLRYDQTKEAEPPVPIIPARSPLRPSLRPPTQPAHRASKSLDCPLQPSSVSQRPSSCILVPTNAGVPPPRPPRPEEEHPALRTITSPGQGTYEDDWKWDYGPAKPAVMAQSQSVWEDSDEEDALARDKMDSLSSRIRITSLRLAPRPKAPSLDSIDESGRKSESSASQVSVPLSSPSLSDSNTLSTATTSPTTPVTEHFSDKLARSLSFRSHKSAKPQTKQLKKRVAPKRDLLAPVQDHFDRWGTDSIVRYSAPPKAHAPPKYNNGPGPAPAHAPNNNAQAHAHAHTHTDNARNAHNSPDSSGSAPEVQVQVQVQVQLPLPSSSYSLTERSPRLSTSIPEASLDINRVSFSQRGSLLYPLYKRNGIIMTDRDSGFGIDTEPVERVKTGGRSFPLVTPSTSKNAQPQSDSPTATLQLGPEPAPAQPSQPQHHHGHSGHSGHSGHNDARGADNDPANADSQRPPSIRVISVEAEKESQKVRSLYESAEGLNWEDGERRASLVDERLQPPEEVPSDGDENDAQDDPQPGPATTRDRATSASPHVNFSRKHLVLAGGFEDWEGVNGEDVDRYGFIIPQRPGSRPTTSSETKSVRFSPYKKRNVLVRRDFASRSLTVRSGPSRKGSARSLNSHVSELSTASRHSTRSAIRQATNLLPHNRDRRLVDEAGSTLATQPGLNDIAEDELAEKLANELKFKEVTRSEKWRRMAKVVKPGTDGQGMIFDFDLKQPKLVSRTWKGIPDCWRSAAWYSFLCSSAKASSKPFVTDEELKADFRQLVEQPSPDDTQIDMDVPRTINQHIMFRRRYRGGQRLLFRVLHALSLYFPETGYVQGMAPLAATLLSYYEEESCFVMLVRLWQFRGLNQMYGTRDSELGELMNILGDFEKYWLGEKDVAKQLAELCIHPTAYATRWYMTLFNLSIPFVVQLRVWDVFMLLGSSPSEPPSPAIPTIRIASDFTPPSQGLEILHATCAAIVDCQRENLMDSDFENAMKSLTSWIPIKDVERFMAIVNIEWKQYMNRPKKP